MNLKKDCIRVKCNTQDEWIRLQELLFSMDIQWPMGKELQFWGQKFPRYLYLNYIDEFLCYNDDDNPVEHTEVNFYTTASVILRKIKLEKINENWNEDTTAL